MDRECLATRAAAASSHGPVAARPVIEGSNLPQARECD